MASVHRTPMTTARALVWNNQRNRLAPRTDQDILRLVCTPCLRLAPTPLGKCRKIPAGTQRTATTPSIIPTSALWQWGSSHPGSTCRRYKGHRILGRVHICQGLLQQNDLGMVARNRVHRPKTHSAAMGRLRVQQWANAGPTGSPTAASNCLWPRHLGPANLVHSQARARTTLLMHPRPRDSKNAGHVQM